MNKGKNFCFNRLKIFRKKFIMNSMNLMVEINVGFKFMVKAIGKNSFNYFYIFTFNFVIFFSIIFFYFKLNLFGGKKLKYYLYILRDKY